MQCSRHHAMCTKVDTTRPSIYPTGWNACMPTRSHESPHTDHTQRIERPTYSMAQHASQTAGLSSAGAAWRRARPPTNPEFNFLMIL
jgi:hypothetical protein